MITVYSYKGKSTALHLLPIDYIPCLVGTNEQGDDAYFETVGEIDASDIILTRRSQWVDHPVQIVAVKYENAEGVTQLGYATADDLMTAGVNF